MTKKRTASKKPTTSITPYLTVRGAASAIEFYKSAFGAKEIARIDVPETKFVQHAELKLAGATLYLCDELPESGILSPLSIGGSATMLDLRVEDADDFWLNALTAGAVEVLPLNNMPWGDRSGKLVDPFGHYWSVSGKAVQSECEADLASTVPAKHVDEEAYSAAV